MKAIRLSRKVHKWFALVLGIQLFLWALSGFYMVAVDIDIIHGDMLVKNMDTNVGSYAQVGIPLERIAGEFPDSSSVTLTAVVDRPAYLYAGDGEVSRVQLIESDPPTELQSRALPLWRVDFDDVWNSSFYVDPNSGQFTTRRHSLWRVFDFLWMLHVMDYDTRSDINNNVLRIFSVFGTLLGLSGVWLLFYSFNRRKVDGIAK